MPKLRVHNLTTSLDGYAAGPDQTLDAPMGRGTEHLHDWFRATRTFRRIFGEPDGGVGGIDDELAARGDEGIGATIMGRNMFGPIRGGWGDDTWRGWWGEEPPYHHPVFVLTHHAKPPLEMEGGTTFHFVTEGPQAALERALEAAGGADVRIGGGAATIQQYLRLGAVDELHLAIVPVLLGAGERLLDGVAGLPEGYAVTEWVGTDAALHVVLAKV